MTASGAGIEYLLCFVPVFPATRGGKKKAEKKGKKKGGGGEGGEGRTHSDGDVCRDSYFVVTFVPKTG